MDEAAGPFWARPEEAGPRGRAVDGRRLPQGLFANPRAGWGTGRSWGVVCYQPATTPGRPKAHLAYHPVSHSPNPEPTA